MDGKLKEIADNYYSVTSVNDFDNSRDCEVLKHKYFMLGCELIYKEMSASQKVSTSDEALPIDDVVKRYLAIGTLGSGKSFRYVDTADTMKCFVEYLNEIYPDFDIDAVIEV